VRAPRGEVARPECERRSPGERTTTVVKSNRPIPCESSVARPAPTSSRRGNGPAPKISTPLPAIFTAVTTDAISIGVRVSRSARSANSSVMPTESGSDALTTSWR
jgi:hypothetical protein